VTGSDRRDKTEVGRTGARFGHVPTAVVHDEEKWGEPAEPADEWVEVDRSRSIVRPYAWTGGRTETAYDLPLEALIQTNRATLQPGTRMTSDHRTVAELCLATRSVAEVAALMSLPLGVARIVLGDMASAGMITVHRTETSAGFEPDLDMMERVLIGLRNL
jgi:hypothetical protein